MPVQVTSICFSSFHKRATAVFHNLFGELAKPALSLFFICISFGGFSNLALGSTVNQGVSVFSTYPSDSLLKACTEQQKSTEIMPAHEALVDLCSEDAISPDSFIKELSESGEFNNLLPYGEGNDYELLIANVGAAPGKRQHHTKQFAEFTLQWRGIEIDSSAYDVGAEIGNGSSKEKEAQLLVSRWLKHVRKAEIFTSQFLFDALEASNYDLALQVPDTVGGFTKLDTQLFSDPFSGAITRYTHPDFEDAIVDVVVYPFLAQLSSQESEILPMQLETDLQKASATAELQRLTLSQVIPTSPYTVNDKVSGWRLGLSATSETSPTIFATTYVFRQQDKIVKVSTTFPPEFSDTIINQLIVKVEVPQESELMKKVRALLIESQH